MLAHMSPNRGSQVLEKLFSERGAQKRIAEATGIDAGYLSNLASANRTPGLDARRKLEKNPETRIPMQWWDEVPEPDQKSAPVQTSETGKVA